MRKIRFVLIFSAILSFVALSFVAFAEEALSDFTFDSEAGSIVKYIGSSEVVDIPGEIEGVPVKSVLDYAFSDNLAVKGVIFPESIESIGENAFLGSNIVIIYCKEGSKVQEYAELKSIPFVNSPLVRIMDEYTGLEVKSLSHIKSKVRVEIDMVNFKSKVIDRNGSNFPMSLELLLGKTGNYNLTVLDKSGNSMNYSFDIDFVQSISYIDKSRGKVRSNGRDYVNMAKYAPDIYSSVVYYTADNILSKKLYKKDICILRRDFADLLIKANKEFMKKGFRLKIYDGYREPSVDKEMTDYVLRDIRKFGSYRQYPDVNMSNFNLYVAYNTSHGYGIAADCTLIDMKTGADIATPTKLDEFKLKASVSRALEYKDYKFFFNTMMKEGNGKIRTIYSEWWHFEMSRVYKVDRPSTKLRAMFY